MKDIIRLGRMSFYGYHGVGASERETGRVFEVDCELGVDLAEAAHSDQLRDTVDYTRVYAIIRDTVEGKAFSLLETLAQKITRRILEEFDVYRVTLRVRKMMPPIAGNIRYIEVEITRTQGDMAKLLDTQNEQEE